MRRRDSEKWSPPRGIVEKQGPYGVQSYLLPEGKVPDGIFDARACEACGCTCRGLEPLFPLPAAAELVPFPTAHAYTQWLSANKSEFPDRYYRQFGKDIYRMIPQREIFKARSMLLIKTKGRLGHPKLSLIRNAWKPLPPNVGTESDPAFGGAFEDDDDGTGGPVITP